MTAQIAAVHRLSHSSPDLLLLVTELQVLSFELLHPMLERQVHPLQSRCKLAPSDGVSLLQFVWPWPTLF